MLEDNGVWREVSIYRRKTTGGVCLYFGGFEYEGLSGTYSYRSGVLRDSDDDLIQVRSVDEREGESRLAESEEELIGGADQELNSYYNDGVSPDFILEDNLS